VLKPELKPVMCKYWCSDWRYVSLARRFCCSRLVLCLLWCAWSKRLL